MENCVFVGYVMYELCFVYVIGFVSSFFTPFLTSSSTSTFAFLITFFNFLSTPSSTISLLSQSDLWHLNNTVIYFIICTKFD